MKKPIEPMQGRGHFVHWNAGQWFGSMIGSSVWMLVASGLLLINHQAAVAMVPSFAFSVSVVCAAVLWGRRDSVTPYKASMIMLSLFAVLFPLVFFSGLFGASQDVLTKLTWTATPWNIAVIVGLCPAMMLYFRFLELRALSRNAKSSPE